MSYIQEASTKAPAEKTTSKTLTSVSLVSGMPESSRKTLFEIEKASWKLTPQAFRPDPSLMMMTPNSRTPRPKLTFSAPPSAINTSPPFAMPFQDQSPRARHIRGFFPKGTTYEDVALYQMLWSNRMDEVRAGAEREAKAEQEQQKYLKRLVDIRNPGENLGALFRAVQTVIVTKSSQPNHTPSTSAVCKDKYGIENSQSAYPVPFKRCDHGYAPQQRLAASLKLIQGSAKYTKSKPSETSRFCSKRSMQEGSNVFSLQHTMREIERTAAGARDMFREETADRFVKLFDAANQEEDLEAKYQKAKHAFESLGIKQPQPAVKKSSGKKCLCQKGPQTNDTGQEKFSGTVKTPKGTNIQRLQTQSALNQKPPMTPISCPEKEIGSIQHVGRNLSPFLKTTLRQAQGHEPQPEAEKGLTVLESRAMGKPKKTVIVRRIPHPCHVDMSISSIRKHTPSGVVQRRHELAMLKLNLGEPLKAITLANTSARRRDV